MTGLRKFTTKDLNAVVDAAQRYSVGFDDLFYRLHSYGMGSVNESYPPYNIVEESNVKWRIEVALAGYNKKDIDVSFEDGQLLIKSKRSDKDESKNSDGNTLYKGIAKRYFERSFTIADDVEVKGAELKDGLLKVSLEKIVPESKKPKTIDIK